MARVKGPKEVVGPVKCPATKAVPVPFKVRACATSSSIPPALAAPVQVPAGLRRATKTSRLVPFGLALTKVVAPNAVAWHINQPATTVLPAASVAIAVVAEAALLAVGVTAYCQV